ncbi:MAG: hypothetical protein K6F61_06400 [Clostridiales bacterium]|nr:hypothetical protein [Clostridiales bacterium]
MFSNIGGKIKKLAVVLCILGMVASVVCAVFCFVNSSRQQDLTLTGVLILVAGCLASWIGSFFTYGFGELIERTVSIDNRLAKGAGRGGANRADTLRQMREEGLLTEEEYRERLNGR